MQSLVVVAYTQLAFTQQTRNSSLGQQQEANARQPKPEKRWVDLLSIPLLMARVSRYTPGTDKLR